MDDRCDMWNSIYVPIQMHCVRHNELSLRILYYHTRKVGRAFGCWRGVARLTKFIEDWHVATGAPDTSVASELRRK